MTLLEPLFRYEVHRFELMRRHACGRARLEMRVSEEPADFIRPIHYWAEASNSSATKRAGPPEPRVSVRAD